MHEPLIRQASQLSEEWMFVVFLCSATILAYLNFSAPFRLKYTWRSVFSPRYMRQVMREESNSPKEYLLLILNFILLSGLLFYGFFTFQGIEIPGIEGILLYLLFCGILLLLYPVKSASISFVQWMAHGDFGLSEYRYLVLLLNRFLGLLLFPVTLLSVYLPIQFALYPLLTGIFLLALVFLYRIIIGLINALRNGVGVFYIFFYICTLEILPLVVCAKLILLQFPGS